MEDESLLRSLVVAEAHAFSAFNDVESLPRTGAGIYTVWDRRERLVYVGIAGRNLTGKGLHGRLKSHYQGRRSGDQFCVYVGDRFVLPTLTARDVDAIANGSASMDDMIRAYIRANLCFRYVEVPDYVTAIRIENAVKAGALGAAPHLNPRSRRADQNLSSTGTKPWRRSSE